MLTIKLLGPGRAHRQRGEVAARLALAQLGAEAEVLKVKDDAEMVKYPTAATPGVGVNESPVGAGRIPFAVEVTSWIATSQEAS